MSDNTKLILGLCNMDEWWRWHRSHTLVCFWTQFRVSRDSFTDLTAGKATVRTFLPRLLTAASRIQNCSYWKIITYQTPQSNLPNDTSLNVTSVAEIFTRRWYAKWHLNVSYVLMLAAMLYRISKVLFWCSWIILQYMAKQAPAS